MRPAPSFVILFCSLSSSLPAWDSYGNGCHVCHGSFTKKPYVSLKNQTVWPDSLHNVHRSKLPYMETACGACHEVDGDATSIQHSREGYGCLGCHGTLTGNGVNGAGLRQQHRATGAHGCLGCHASPENSPPEGTIPPYYGTALTRADDPCNALPDSLEDWSGDGLGLDNDGDGLYDSSDPDCSGDPGKRFHRGDPNDDDVMNITDGIYVLNFLFLGGPAPTCLESADPNNDGDVNLTDGIYILNSLFLGGPAPSPPGSPESPCGTDERDSEDLGCASYTSCG